jgi:hypothetical protein
VFTVLLLTVRAVNLMYIFVDGELGSGIYKTFAAAECATFLMTCVGFSLLIQWYEVYHLLREAAGLEKEKDAHYFKSLWYKTLAVFTLFYAIESVFVLTELFSHPKNANWKVAKICFCTIEGVAMVSVILGFLVLIVFFSKLFKVYDQFEPMKTSLIVFCSIVIFIQVLRLTAYVIYQAVVNHPYSTLVKDFLITFVFFNVAVELTLNGFVLYYSRKSTSSGRDR